MHGESLGPYAYGLWTVVIYYVLFFLLFAISFLRPKKRYEWRSMGALTGFLVALFTEMFGFPLTIYLLTGVMGKAYPNIDPFSHSGGHLILVLLGKSESHTALNNLHLVSNSAILIGSLIVFIGWILIHRSRGDVLIKRGLYGIVRHPQYSGLFLITTGFMIQWPSLLVFIMWPVMIAAYVRLAKREDDDLAEAFGSRFLEYRKSVPAFFPRIIPSRLHNGTFSGGFRQPR